MRNATIILAVVMLALAVPVNGASWTGADAGNNNWNDGDNWDGGSPPGVGETTTVNCGTSGNGPAVIQAGTNATVGVLGLGKYSEGHLEVYGNLNQSGTNDFAIGYGGASAGYHASLTQHSGTITVAGWHMDICYVWNGGANNRGTYEIRGGTLAVASSRTIRVGSGGVGEFVVVGSGPDAIGAGYYTQSSISKLELQFDGDTDPIQQIDIANDVTLAGTLVVTGSADTSLTKTFTIIDYDGTLSTTFDDITSLTAKGWTISYDDSNCDGIDDPGGTGVNSKVTVTVPEPATMALLGLGGIGVLVRRRRK